MLKETFGSREPYPDEHKKLRLQKELLNVEQHIRNIQNSNAMMKLYLTQDKSLKWDEAARDVIVELSEKKTSLQHELDNLRSANDVEEN